MICPNPAICDIPSTWVVPAEVILKLNAALMVQVNDDVLGTIEYTGTDKSLVEACEDCLTYLAEHAGQSLSTWKSSLAGRATEFPLIDANALPFLQELKNKMTSGGQEMESPGSPTEAMLQGRKKRRLTATTTQVEKLADELALLKLVVTSFAKQSHTQNQVSWPVENNDILCVFSRHSPRTGVYTKFAAICDIRSTWVVPAEFVPCLKQLFGEWLSACGKAAQELNLIPFAKVLGLVFPVVCHQPNKDLGFVLNQWANHQGGEGSPCIGDYALNNAAVRLAVAHQVIQVDGVARLASGSMDEFMSQYDLQVFVAWRAVRQYSEGMGLIGGPLPRYTTHGVLVTSNFWAEEPSRGFTDEEAVTPSCRPYHTGNSPVTIHKDTRPKGKNVTFSDRLSLTEEIMPSSQISGRPPTPTSLPSATGTLSLTPLESAISSVRVSTISTWKAWLSLRSGTQASSRGPLDVRLAATYTLICRNSTRSLMAQDMKTTIR